MRGSPLLRALIAFLIILSLGWPLWRLTHSEAAPRASAIAAVESAQRITLHLTFTAAPSQVRVLHLGREIWSVLAPTAEIERTLSLPYPAEGVDLQFQITWPTETTTASAARVTLTDPAGDNHTKIIWAKGSADEVLTFP